MENSLAKCHFFVKKDVYGNVMCIYQLDETFKNVSSRNKRGKRGGYYLFGRNRV